MYFSGYDWWDTKILPVYTQTPWKAPKQSFWVAIIGQIDKSSSSLILISITVYKSKLKKKKAIWVNSPQTVSGLFKHSQVWMDWEILLPLYGNNI